MRRIALILLGAALILCGCQEDRLISAFSARDQIRLQVGGEEKMSYDPLSCQLAYNPVTREFRVHSDNMSDFFYLVLSAIPSGDDETVKGSLVYTTRTDIVRKNNVTLKAVRLEGDKIWLWSQSGQIGVEIQVLD